MFSCRNMNYFVKLATGITGSSFASVVSCMIKPESQVLCWVAGSNLCHLYQCLGQAFSKAPLLIVSFHPCRPWDQTEQGPVLVLPFISCVIFRKAPSLLEPVFSCICVPLPLPHTLWGTRSAWLLYIKCMNYVSISLF